MHRQNIYRNVLGYLFNDLFQPCSELHMWKSALRRCVPKSQICVAGYIQQQNHCQIPQTIAWNLSTIPLVCRWRPVQAGIAALKGM